jgi:hypothetical protein
MKFIASYFANLITLETILLGSFFGATAAQLHFIGPVLMFSIFYGAPVAAAFLVLSDD